MDRRTRDVLIFVQVCYGLFPWLGKLAMVGFEPRAVLVWRLAAGTLVLGAAAVWRHGRRALPARADLLHLALLSLLGIVVNQLLFLEGLSRSTAVNAGLLMCIIPVVTVAAALLTKQERPTGRSQLGIVLAVAGVGWMFVGRGAGLSAGTALGDLLLTLNAVSYSLYLVAAKPLLRRLPRLVLGAWIFAIGLMTVPWFCRDVDWVPPDASATQWWALAGVLIFPTVLAYLLNIVVLARVAASTTAAFVMLQPLLASALGIGLLGERPEPSLLITAAAVLSGLWLVSARGVRAAASVD
ncbi:MAG: hypothetical protein DRQ55_01710 [Planctomycetota bacterium]|nr:MAG: hypothetical protein DRQ55_01710 [Planctomycetota bacterium]